MPHRSLWLSVLLSLLLPVCAFALGGTGAAPIDESVITITLHVDASAKSGGNGSAASPFNTLQAALNRTVHTHNAASQSVRVQLAPGTYREGTPGATNASSLPSPSTAAPIVVEGAGWNPAAPAHTGNVIRSGSEAWNSGWTPAADGTWTRPWPYAWGVGPNNTGGGNPLTSDTGPHVRITNIGTHLTLPSCAPAPTSPTKSSPAPTSSPGP